MGMIIEIQNDFFYDAHDEKKETVLNFQEHKLVYFKVFLS